MLARLFLVALFIGLWLFLLFAGYRMPTGFLVVLVAEGIALVGFRRLVAEAPDIAALQRRHYGLLGVELGCHTVMVYFLGGISWLGPIAYIYALMYAAVFLTLRQAIMFTGLVVVCFLSVVLLDGAGVLPHQWYLSQEPDRYKDPGFVFTTAVAFVGVLMTVTFWMVFIGQQLRRERDVALRANRELVKAQAELRRLNEQLEQKVEERTRALAWRAEHDALTGLLNRDAITLRCQELLSLARRGGRSLGIVIADGDNFKACNDTSGHGYGDEVLRATAECLRRSCRESDVVGRIGGDEFLIVLPDTNAAGSLRFCRRLLREVSARRRTWHLRGPDLPTLSLGIAVYPDCGSDVDELVRVADHAMYAAKESGGNRVCIGESGATFGTGRRTRRPMTG